MRTLVVIPCKNLEDEVGDVVRQSVINKKREELLTALLDKARESVTIDFVEENFKYIKDPVEVLKEKQQSGTQTASISVN